MHVAITFKEVDDKGSGHTSKRIPVLPISGVLPSNCTALVIVLDSLYWAVMRDNETATDEVPGAEKETGCSHATGDQNNRMEHK